MQTLDDGGAFVGWGGMQPWMTEFGADAAPDWDARFVAPKVESYRAYRLPWAGDRRGAARRGGARAPRVRELERRHRRRVAGGCTPEGGAPVTAERTGFETAITLPRPAASVRVAALDADGEVLGARRSRLRRSSARARRSSSGTMPARRADVVVQRRVQRRLELRPQRRGLRVAPGGRSRRSSALRRSRPGHPEPPQQRAPAALGGRLEPARVERGVAHAEERERAPVLGRPGPPGSARTAAPGSARDRRSGAAGRAGRRAGAGRRRRSCRRSRPRRARRAGRRRSRGSARSGRRPSRAASRPAPRGAAAAASRRRTCSGRSTRRSTVPGRRGKWAW